MRFSTLIMIGIIFFTVSFFSEAKAQVVSEQETALKVLLKGRLHDYDTELLKILSKAYIDEEFRTGLVEAIRGRLDSYERPHNGRLEYRALGHLAAFEAREQLLQRWENMEKHWWGGARSQLLHTLTKIMTHKESVELLMKTEGDEEEDPRVRHKAAMLLIESRSEKGMAHLVLGYQQAVRRYPVAMREYRKISYREPPKWDGDMDELDWYTETGLLLDPENDDTDGDGLLDGNDRNPHMKSSPAKTEGQQIAHVLFYMYARYTSLPLEISPFKFRVWVLDTVDTYDSKGNPSLFSGQELTGVNGVVLHMSRAEKDRYRALHKYGTPFVNIHEDKESRGAEIRIFHMSELIANAGVTGWEIRVKKFGEIWLPVYWEVTWMS